MQKKLSITKLQKQIHKQLSNLQNRRPTSLTSFPSQDSLRSSFSKSVKSIFLDQQIKLKKNRSFKDRSISPKSCKKETKLGRSQDVLQLKNSKNTIGKLKKKKSQGLTRQFTTMSRKQSQPTQIGSSISSYKSFQSLQIRKLQQMNKIYQKKINDQNILIQRLQSIIQELGN